MLICDRYLEEQSIRGGTYLGAAAFHLKVKSFYKNPTIYKFNYSRHAEFFGVSESSLRRYVSILLKEGTAFFNGSNLQFKGTDRIKKDYGTKRICHIDISRNDSISDIKDKIRVLILRENHIEQKCIISKKMIKLDAAKICSDEIAHTTVHISLNGIAKLLGLTLSGAQKFIERAKQKKMISSRMVYTIIKHVKANFDICRFREYENTGFYFVRGGKLYRHNGQTYMFHGIANYPAKLL
jgi:hypothetical protein